MYFLVFKNHNANITSQFVRVFKVFEDFRFISQLREEIKILSDLTIS